MQRRTRDRAEVVHRRYRETILHPLRLCPAQPVREKVIRIEHLVAEIVISHAMKMICAGFGSDAYDTPGRTAATTGKIAAVDSLKSRIRGVQSSSFSLRVS